MKMCKKFVKIYNHLYTLCFIIINCDGTMNTGAKVEG